MWHLSGLASCLQTTVANLAAYDEGSGNEHSDKNLRLVQPEAEAKFTDTQLSRGVSVDLDSHSSEPDTTPKRAWVTVPLCYEKNPATMEVAGLS